MTDVPGLHFLGLSWQHSWQHTRGSALLGWVGVDAEFIAQQIATFAEAESSADGNAIENEGVRVPTATPVTEGA